MLGTTTNAYGFFSMTISEDDYTLVISFLGYKQIEREVILDQDIRLNFELEEQVFVTDEVVITAEREDENVISTETGTINLKVKDIQALPSFLGEVDVLKTIQLLPGVQSAGDGNAGFFVRGGSADQNLILLDEAIIYNASHLFGFFSVFNSEALKDVNLISVSKKTALFL